MNNNQNSKHGIRLTGENGSPVPQRDNFSINRSFSENLYLIEKLSHFDREKIPERIIFSNGKGFFGIFCAKDMSSVTSADFLSSIGKTTKVFARLSSMSESRFDINSLSIKFYTETGIYDIILLDKPVFYIRDPIKFPDLVHALLPSASSGRKDRERFFDFISLSPESTNLLVRLYSTDTNPNIKSYYSIHTFIFHTESSFRYVKYRADCNLKKENIYITLKAQLFSEEDIEKLNLKPFDTTRLIPEGKIGYTDIGSIELSRPSENYFKDVEQSAFSPSNTVPGIALTHSLMLSAHAFSASDSQRYRLGVNYMQLEINHPINPERNCMRGGYMNNISENSAVDYIPNSLEYNLPSYSRSSFKAPYKSSMYEYDADYFSQAGEYLSGLSDDETRQIAINLSNELKGRRYEIRRRIISNISKASYRLADFILYYLSE